MKNFFKVLLVLLILGLGYACFNSIETPRKFDRLKTAREKLIIKELIDIRSAQIAYKQEHFTHAKTFDELKNWLQNGTMKTVRKEMELTEKQLEDGLTEVKALEIVKKAKATGKWKDAEEAGLVQEINGVRKVFTRDTTLINAAVAVFGEDVDMSRISKMGRVPGTEVMFDMDTASVMTASGYDIKIFQASVPYTSYLGDLDKGELANLIDKQVQYGRFPGLKVGSLTEINNNAGNWE